MFIPSPENDRGQQHGTGFCNYVNSEDSFKDLNELSKMGSFVKQTLLSYLKS